MAPPKAPPPRRPSLVRMVRLLHHFLAAPPSPHHLLGTPPASPPHHLPPCLPCSRRQRWRAGSRDSPVLPYNSFISHYSAAPESLSPPLPGLTQSCLSLPSCCSSSSFRVGYCKALVLTPVFIPRVGPSLLPNLKCLPLCSKLHASALLR